MSPIRVLYVGNRPDRGLRLVDRDGDADALTVTVASNTATAIAHVTESPVDCIVVEPETAFEPFLDYVRTDGLSIPVVVDAHPEGDAGAPAADRYDMICDGESGDVVDAIRELAGARSESNETPRAAVDGSEVAPDRVSAAQSPVGLLQFDETGTVRSVNEAAHSVLETTRSALVDRNVSADGGGSPISQLAEAWRTSIRAGSPQEVRIDARDKPIRATAVPLPNGGGQVVIRAAGSRGREAPVTAEPFFVETVMNSLADVVFVLDLDLNFVHWNDRLNAVTGYDDVEIRTMSPLDFFGDDEMTEATEALTEIMETGYASRELTLSTRYGEEIPYEFTGSLVYDENGDPEYFCGVARDITERKQAAAALRESEQQLNSIIEGVTDYAIFRVSPEGSIESWNSGAQAITGYTEEEILGEDISVFYTDSAVEMGRPDRNLADAAERGRMEDEGWRIRADGSRFWAHVVLTALHDENDELDGFVMVTRDMTERRRYEERLRHEKELTERILETSPVAITVIEEDGSLVRANTHAKAVLGVDESDDMALVQDLYDADGDPVPVGERPYIAIFESGEPVYDWLCQLDPGHGERRWLSVSAAPIFDDDGSVDQVIIAAEDVTELKTRQEELVKERNQTEELLRTTPIAISVRDVDGNTILANRRAQNALGLPERDVVEGPADADGWTINDEVSPEPDSELIDRVVETGEPVFDREMAIERPDGEERWFSVNVVPVFGSDGELAKVISAGEDITTLKERERELKRQRAELDAVVEELRRSNAELEQFAYVASHDLKEPLRMVSSYLQLIERRYAHALDEDGVEFIEYAVDGAERMRSMISALLTYSRLGRQGESFESIDCNDVVEAVLANLEVAIDESNAEVNVGSLPTLVGDADQLRQLFQNLVSNAIEYADESAPTVSITTEEWDGEWRFKIEDNGVGIPAERTERIFDIFESDPDRGGTGIGLAICQKIVNRHGGRIWVESEPGEGSAFYFTIPNEQNRDAPAAAANRV